MRDKVMANEENLQLYHEYFNTLITDYFESGKFKSTVTRVSTMICPYVESDPTAWYTAEEFDIAVNTITQLCVLCAQSIRSQLDGTLASTTAEQETANLIDTSTIDISAMGIQGKGRVDEGKRNLKKETVTTYEKEK